ncbi:kinetochore-associated Ndc80 complex subunit nuf2 [Epichloe bromicola]|uniref:Kinetochore-associated Ndc80 complex subunit nuf2 n=1 Tax=Epichloe bromicola TaxID=79588 RepID=A0ABQ0CG75_9HYPO
MSSSRILASLASNARSHGAASTRPLTASRAFHASPAGRVVHKVKTYSEDAAFKDKVHFIKFDVDELPAVAQALGVRAMPTFFFFRGGKKVDEMVGANPRALLEALRKVCSG